MIVWNTQESTGSLEYERSQEFKRSQESKLCGVQNVSRVLKVARVWKVSRVQNVARAWLVWRVWKLSEIWRVCTHSRVWLCSRVWIIDWPCQSLILVKTDQPTHPHQSPHFPTAESYCYLTKSLTIKLKRLKHITFTFTNILINFRSQSSINRNH